MRHRPVKGFGGFAFLAIVHTPDPRSAGMYGISPFRKATSRVSLGAWRKSVNKPLTFGIQTSGLSAIRHTRHSDSPGKTGRSDRRRPAHHGEAGVHGSHPRSWNAPCGS